MLFDPWLPVRFELSPTVQTGRLLHGGQSFQIMQTSGTSNRALIVWPQVAERWISSGLIEAGQLTEVTFGDERWFALVTEDRCVAPIAALDKPYGATEARSFCLALARTRAKCPELGLASSVLVESLGLLLPVEELGMAISDEVLLGRYLSGGVEVSCYARDRMSRLAPWLSQSDLRQLCEWAGQPAPPDFVPALADNSSTGLPASATQSEVADNGKDAPAEQGSFALPGRRDLEAFLLEHVIDIVRYPERYQALGVEFPGAVVLYGPPGSGKTFAVEQLVAYLRWPSFSIDSNSIGSPYIHATGQKIADIFERAVHHAPSVVIIDEMEAFLADRHGGGQHRLEEVAEFLRLIPEMQKKRVLVVGMTNRIDTIDKAILRRGRVDHQIKVELPTEQEIAELIGSLLETRPREENLSLSGAIRYLVGRPLSDAAFFVREAARLAARAGKSKIDDISIAQALRSMQQS